MQKIQKGSMTKYYDYVIRLMARYNFSLHQALWVLSNMVYATVDRFDSLCARIYTDRRAVSSQGKMLSIRSQDIADRVYSI